VNLEILRQWYSAHHRPLLEYVFRTAPGVDATDILLRMLRQVHTCESLTEPDFLKWAMDFIGAEVHERQWYDSFKSLSIADVLALAATKRRANCRPMMTEAHGDRTFIKLDCKKGFKVWTIPSDWLPVACALWPCHAKYSRSIGWFVCKSSKRQRRDGTWISVDIPVHHLYANAREGERVIAHDGNFLNFQPGNLELEDDGKERDAANPDAPPSHETPLRTEANPAEWVPARRTPVPIIEKPAAVSVSEIRRAWGVRSGL
jgi:hypothetical protein